jgi:hypothetical protein
LVRAGFWGGGVEDFGQAGFEVERGFDDVAEAGEEQACFVGFAGGGFGGFGRGEGCGIAGEIAFGAGGGGAQEAQGAFAHFPGDMYVARGTLGIVAELGGGGGGHSGRFLAFGSEL